MGASAWPAAAFFSIQILRRCLSLASGHVASIESSTWSRAYSEGKKVGAAPTPAMGRDRGDGRNGLEDGHRSRSPEVGRRQHPVSRRCSPERSRKKGDRNRARDGSREGRLNRRRDRSPCSDSDSDSDSLQDEDGRRQRRRASSCSTSRERIRRAKRKSKWGQEQPNETTRESESCVDSSQKQESQAEREPKAESEPEEDSEPLPVTLFKEELMKAVRASQVLVCTGETGSGKTTQIPQYLLELVRERDADDAGDNHDDGDGKEARLAPGSRTIPSGPRKLIVAVTQPRRVAATSVARRVADERGCRLGEEVGYSIRFEDRTGPRTRIKYMTDGVLVRECLEDPYLSRYGVVMLDEAHERSIDTDILFGLLKRALAKRPDLHAVITSATLDVERFSKFFGGCPFLHVPGRTHAVDVYHSKTRQVREEGSASPWYRMSRVAYR